MGLLFKARGNNSFGIFLIRFVIGFIFIYAGTKKAMGVEAFIGYVKSLEILPDNLAFIFGFLLPFAEIFFGVLFLIGFLTPFTSIMLIIMELGFIAVNSHLGSSSNMYSISPVAYNILMLACTFHVLFAGAGVVSFDVFLDKKKKEKRIINVVGENPPSPPVTPPPVINETEIKDAEFKEQ
jgi:uncharacterized membrane protein YphA (DoxX/SURF4 family)